MQEVSSYSYTLNDADTKVAMYKKGSKYGVITIRGDVASTLDYQNDDERELRAYVGNEEKLIDWTSLDEAKKRYAELLSLCVKRDFNIFMGQEQVKDKVKFPLRLVHGTGAQR